MRDATFTEENVVAALVRESFYDFLLEFWDMVSGEPLKTNWHIRYICDQMQAMAERVFLHQPKTHDLVINIPPGSSKSTICSQMFPAWVWTRMPKAQFICASYAHAIALKDSLRTRDIVESELYQRCFNIQMREDQNTKSLFVNTQKGFRLSAGVGGAVTGHHGHFLIVDDPLDPEQSYSEAELRTINRWMETTLPSRKVDKEVTPLILIQQRLHQDDPSGRMIQKPGVVHICLPGEKTEHVSPPSLADQYVDGLLDQRRLPRLVLESLRKDLGEYGFASQVLQHPVPLGGGLFKVDQFRLADVAPRRLVRQVRSWDKAGTEGAGKYTVGLLMALDEKEQYWVLDVKRDQLGATRREALIRQTAELDGIDTDVVLEIEGGSGGKESGENTVRSLAGFTVRAYHPTGDKQARAYAYASQVGAGNVSVLNRPWTKAYLDELRFFPFGTYSDQVDASSGAFNYLARKKVRVGGW